MLVFLVYICVILRVGLFVAGAFHASTKERKRQVSETEILPAWVEILVSDPKGLGLTILSAKQLRPVNEMTGTALVKYHRIIQREYDNHIIKDVRRFF